MSETELTAEVAALVEERISRGETSPMTWLVHAVVKAHPDISGSDTDFYVLCAYGHVRDAVREVLRRYRPEEEKQGERDPQLVLPGFERLQRAYPVSRNGEQVVVPIQCMTAAEGDAKADELEAMASGCRLHAKELRRYFTTRGETANA